MVIYLTVYYIPTLILIKYIKNKIELKIGKDFANVYK